MDDSSDSSINAGPSRAQAQKQVLQALEELKRTAVDASDNVQYLNAEATLQVFVIPNAATIACEAFAISSQSTTGTKFRNLERTASKVYTPFRAALFEYAAEMKNSRDTSS
eukprot:CAMPEP_0184317508 /NCGR_PEP_ID=MMETSP1049-20130417/97056_1 /TAXON_ID=77928 /ORGANISM="Proteomonas sulcata, Strain CCMP704" /LENGTH=110 /DNA_ID=CAMNT_0026636909 /DNA_START=171 /DNA_END=501 /DNA_ORIENTATION=+